MRAILATKETTLRQTVCYENHGIPLNGFHVNNYESSMQTRKDFAAARHCSRLVAKIKHFRG